MAGFVPAVEVADDEDPFRVRRPYGEIGAAFALLARQASAELVVKPEVASLVEKIQIIVGQQAGRLSDFRPI
jgi:hypothetical protein